MVPFRNPALSMDERLQDLLERLTVDEKIGMLPTHQLPVERLGIGEWYVGHEVARGLVNREQEKPSTVFPQPIGMAASFDPEMMHEIGRIAAREARAYYNEDQTQLWAASIQSMSKPTVSYV